MWRKYVIVYICNLFCILFAFAAGVLNNDRIIIIIGGIFLGANWYYMKQLGKQQDKEQVKKKPDND